MARPRRLLVPPLRGPVPHAGGWGLPGPGIGRPPSASVGSYAGLQRFPIRYGEGTGTALVNAAGAAVVSVGPAALNTWYVTYAAIMTTTGALDAATAGVIVGPISAGLVPAGQSYAGGGDSVGLGNQVLRPGDFITVVWAGGHPGDTATLTVFGTQDVPV
jgi:hypothetical protein